MVALLGKLTVAEPPWQGSAGWEGISCWPTGHTTFWPKPPVWQPPSWRRMIFLLVASALKIPELRDIIAAFERRLRRRRAASQFGKTACGRFCGLSIPGRHPLGRPPVVQIALLRVCRTSAPLPPAKRRDFCQLPRWLPHAVASATSSWVLFCEGGRPLTQLARTGCRPAVRVSTQPASVRRLCPRKVLASRPARRLAVHACTHDRRAPSGTACTPPVGWP